ncbi:hypothetical protein D3C78_1565680 [compost metagenome]
MLHIAIQHHDRTGKFGLAEVTAKVDMELFDNNWVHIYSSVGLMYTQITHSGTLTVYC